MTSSSSIVILMMLICARRVETEIGEREREANEFNWRSAQIAPTHRTCAGAHTVCGGIIWVKSQKDVELIPPSGKLLADSGLTGGPQEGGIFFLIRDRHHQRSDEMKSL